MLVFHPGKEFPSLSVTGPHCALRCKHCNATYLQHMIPVETPEKLKRFAVENEGKIKGFLLSGGSTPEGKVPLWRYVDAVRWIKRNTGLKVNIHTGFLEDKDMEWIERMEPDHISFDVVGSTEVISNVLGLPWKGEDYLRSLELLDNSSVPYSPHIIAALDFGKVWWEFETIDFISSLSRFSNLVLIVLIPTRGTPMENVKVKEEDIIPVLEYAVRTLGPGKVVLGCMRPRWMLNLERRAVELGIKGMVLPSPKTIRYIEEMGIPVERRNTCCVM